MGFDQETWRRGEKLISRVDPQQMGWPCNRLCRSFATRWIRVTQTHGTSNSWKILTDPLPNRVRKNKFNDQILRFVSQVAPNFRPSDIRRVVAVFQRLHGFLQSTGSEAWTALAAVDCWVVGNSSTRLSKMDPDPQYGGFRFVMGVPPVLILFSLLFSHGNKPNPASCSWGSSIQPVDRSLDWILRSEFSATGNQDLVNQIASGYD